MTLGQGSFPNDPLEEWDIRGRTAFRPLHLSNDLKDKDQNIRVSLMSL